MLPISINLSSEVKDTSLTLNSALPPLSKSIYTEIAQRALSNNSSTLFCQPLVAMDSLVTALPPLIEHLEQAQINEIAKFFLQYKSAEVPYSSPPFDIDCNFSQISIGKIDDALFQLGGPALRKISLNYMEAALNAGQFSATIPILRYFPYNLWDVSRLPNATKLPYYDQIRCLLKWIWPKAGIDMWTSHEEYTALNNALEPLINNNLIRNQLGGLERCVVWDFNTQKKILEKDYKYIALHTLHQYESEPGPRLYQHLSLKLRSDPTVALTAMCTVWDDEDLEANWKAVPDHLKKNVEFVERACQSNEDFAQFLSK